MEKTLDFTTVRRGGRWWDDCHGRRHAGSIALEWSRGGLQPNIAGVSIAGVDLPNQTLCTSYGSCYLLHQVDYTLWIKRKGNTSCLFQPFFPAMRACFHAIFLVVHWWSVITLGSKGGLVIYVWWKSLKSCCQHPFISDDGLEHVSCSCFGNVRPTLTDRTFFSSADTCWSTRSERKHLLSSKSKTRFVHLLVLQIPC